MANISRSDAALRLLSYASEELRLSDQETAAALAVAVAYVADNPENLLSVIQLIVESHRVVNVE
jgi:hemoglobin-like flavoprotein